MEKKDKIFQTNINNFILNKSASMNEYIIENKIGKYLFHHILCLETTCQQFSDINQIIHKAKLLS
jgi:hypothetical protein